MFRFRFRRRSVTAKLGMVAAAIALVAIASLPGAGATLASQAAPAAAVSAAATSSAASAASAEGDTKCVPWGKDDLGLKCTGTYSGNTAFNPWTQSNLPAADQPTVTVSQVKDLTDQDIQINWSNITPTIDASGLAGYGPNPGATSSGEVYQVSVFECNGTTPDWQTGYTNCYVPVVGTSVTEGAQSGPPNAQLDNTIDGAAPPAIATSTDPLNGTSAYSPAADYPDFAEFFGPPDPLPDGSTFNGGDPGTWTGQADFHVEAPTPRTKGGFFNCSSTTPCSLVIDPNWGGTSAGGTSDYTDTSQCNVHQFGFLGPGDFYGVNNGGEGSNQGGLGQSAACWVANRIVIPLSFAPTPQNCPDKAPQFFAAGSPMMQLQMNQWLTGWCTGSGGDLSVQYAANSESVAREQFLAAKQAGGASTDMALVTLPADASAQQASSRKFTYAPLANSGTGVAFYVDDAATGTQMSKMVLDPRVLAKLTTQSYALGYGCTAQPGENIPTPWPPLPNPSETCDPAVQKNPVSLWDDQEFLSLNENCEPYGQAASYDCGEHAATDDVAAYSDFPIDTSRSGLELGSFLPTVLQPDSDMTYDLTGMIGANSDATGFLGGKTDPWGMHVNNNYLDVSYPVQAFSVLDNGTTNPDSPLSCPSQNGLPDCGSAEVWNATMNVSWNFQTDLDTIAQDLLTNQPTAEDPVLACPSSIGGGAGCTNVNQLTYPTLGAQTAGYRTLLSVLDLGDIGNYQFPAASIVNASGTPVAPSQASVEAAVKEMKTNPDGITQYYDYSSTGKSAYPLSMVDYAMVPTCGLSKSEASDIAEFLTKAATTGQTQGEAPGQLGPGYYPLTAAQKAQTLKAAAEVKAQDCKTVPADHTIGGHQHVNDVGKNTGTGPAGTTTGTAPGGSGGGTTTSPAATGGKTPKTGKKASPSPSASQSTAPASRAQAAAFGQKSPDSGLTGLLLLLAIIAGALVLVGGPAAWALTATGKWPVLVGWIRPAAAGIRAVPARLRAIRIGRR